MELERSTTLDKLVGLFLCFGDADRDNVLGDTLLGGNGNKVSSFVLLLNLGEGFGDILSNSVWLSRSFSLWSLFRLLLLKLELNDLCGISLWMVRMLVFGFSVFGRDFFLSSLCVPFSMIDSKFRMVSSSRMLVFEKKCSLLTFPSNGVGGGAPVPGRTKKNQIINDSDKCRKNASP